MNIVAIGGGDIGAGSTASIDRVLLDLSGKAKPHVLFIPTASNDSADYVRAVEQGMGRLGAKVSALRLYSDDADPEWAKQRIEAADVIYVGGGNTKAMLALWRELGIDAVLRDFANSGKPLGGLSAGAICWFRLANSDWPQYEGIRGVNTAPLEGLGLVNLAICPHTRDEGFRLREFKAMMQGVAGVGIGVDDDAALQIRGDEYRVLASRPGMVAHRLKNVGSHVIVEDMPPHEDFRPLAELEHLTLGVG